MSARKLRPEVVWLLLFAGLLVALLLFGAGFLFKKYAWAQDRLRDIEPRYALMTGLAQEKDKLAAIQAELGANYGRYVYPAKGDASQDGNEALQRVRDMATAAKLQVLSSQVMPPREDGGLQRIGLNLRVEGNYEAVMQFLETLSRSEPVIYSESTQLTSQSARRFVPMMRRGQPQAPAAEEAQPLEATAQLTLFVLKAMP